MNRPFFNLFLAGIVLVGVAACGGDSDDDGESNTSVVELRLDSDELRIGEDTVLRVRFRFDESDIFSDDETVFVTLVLPPGIEYLVDSSELDTVIGDDDLSAEVFDCASGEEVVGYVLDGDELIDAEDPSGSANAEISLTIVGDSRQPLAAIQARASRFVPDGCSEGFLADQQVGVSVR